MPVHIYKEAGAAAEGHAAFRIHLNGRNAAQDINSRASLCGNGCRTAEFLTVQTIDDLAFLSSRYSLIKNLHHRKDGCGVWLLCV